jgi:hypothetical protein
VSESKSGTGALKMKFKRIARSHALWSEAPCALSMSDFSQAFAAASYRATTYTKISRDFFLINLSPGR